MDQNTDAASSFNEGMASLAGMLGYAVVLAYALGRVSSIVDVGGGNGRFLETILEIYPQLQGTVFDCASTIEPTRRTASRTSPRCSYVAGNFLLPFRRAEIGAFSVVWCTIEPMNAL